jgi:hypothetical protein
VETALDGFEPGPINTVTNSAGLRIEFNTGGECRHGSSSTPFGISGTAIGEIMPVNTRSNRFAVRFRRNGFEQLPPSFEAGPPTVLETIFGAGPSAPAAIDTTVFFRFPTVTELRY